MENNSTQAMPKSVKIPKGNNGAQKDGDDLIKRIETVCEGVERLMPAYIKLQKAVEGIYGELEFFGIWNDKLGDNLVWLNEHVYDMETYLKRMGKEDRVFENAKLIRNILKEFRRASGVRGMMVRVPSDPREYRTFDDRVDVLIRAQEEGELEIYINAEKDDGTTPMMTKRQKKFIKGLYALNTMDLAEGDATLKKKTAAGLIKMALAIRDVLVWLKLRVVVCENVTKVFDLFDVDEFLKKIDNSLTSTQEE